MARRPRRNHSAAFKAKVALDAIRGEKHDPHANPIIDWKIPLLELAATVFGATTHPDEPPVDMKVLHAKIGQQALEIEF